MLKRWLAVYNNKSTVCAQTKECGRDHGDQRPDGVGVRGRGAAVHDPGGGDAVRIADSAHLTASAERVRDGEIRVTVLGSGDPFVKSSQACASLLIEVGNPERDLFFFDLGSGAVANYTGLALPVTAATKVFLTHLHADHVGDMPTMVWSMAKAGRRDLVEVWGPARGDPGAGDPGLHRAPGGRARLGHVVAARAPGSVRCPDGDHGGSLGPDRDGV